MYYVDFFLLPSTSPTPSHSIPFFRLLGNLWRIQRGEGAHVDSQVFLFSFSPFFSPSALPPCTNIYGVILSRVSFLHFTLQPSSPATVYVDKRANWHQFSGKLLSSLLFTTRKKYFMWREAFYNELNRREIGKLFFCQTIFRNKGVRLYVWEGISEDVVHRRKISYSMGNEVRAQMSPMGGFAWRNNFA